VSTFLFIVGIAEIAGVLCSLIAPLLDLFNPRKVFIVGELITIVGFIMALSKSSLLVVAIGWFVFLWGGAIIGSSIQV
jgi:hypothetical protein